MRSGEKLKFVQRLDQPLQIVVAAFLFGYLGLGHDVIDNHVFKDRRAQLLLQLLVLLHEIEIGAFLPRILALGRKDGLRHLGVCHFHPGLAAAVPIAKAQKAVP